uniref:Alpha/beta hydrolase fold-3 domain-containing protein n=1 Tax=Periophthalmus magnuspinnatus TaxID=409849 RepID=A0A3B3Z8Z2_9GOBI
MGPFSVVFTFLLTASLAYYVYTPFPDGVEEPWKLMLLDATFRTAAKFVRISHLCILRFREVLLESDAGEDFVPGVKVSDVTFSGVPVRVYEASGGQGGLRRGLLYFHGGGWALGRASNYRLYPEVQFPEPYLDCLAAAKHFLSAEVLSRYSVDPERVGVSGDSAGGNLAAAVAQEVHTLTKYDYNYHVCRAQALVYPALQALDFHTPSCIQNQNIPVLSRSSLVQFWIQYLGVDLSLKEPFLSNQHSGLQQPLLTPELRARFNWTLLLSAEHQKNQSPVVAGQGLEGILEKAPGLLDIRASPLLANPEVLSKCPKAYILTCEFDVLRDDGLMYTQRLQNVGVQVTNAHYKDGFHGCFSMLFWPLEFDVGRRAFRHYISWLQDNL